MDSTILKTRLDVLSANLQAVRSVLEAAERRGQEMDGLRRRLFGVNGVRPLVRNLEKEIRKVKVDLDDPDLQQFDAVASAFSGLEKTAAYLEQLVASLEACEAELAALLQGRVELERTVHERLKERLADKAVEGLGGLDAIRRTIDTPGVEPEHDALKRAWAEEERLGRLSAPLFAEYVDLLHGLALRETGLERGVGQLADRLLDGCDRVVGAYWRSLAIPAYRGLGELTPAQIIRLGFPEWTIWAVPLAAYEFGRIVLAPDRRLHDATAALREQHPALAALGPVDDSLADAFAAYTVGPAYACAALLMRLDPRPAPDGRPKDHGRVQVILGLLALTDEQAGAGLSFADTRERLRQAWNDAVVQAGAELPAAAGAEAVALDALLATFVEWADKNAFTARYSAAAWELAEDWKTRMLDLLHDPDAIVPRGDDVRDVLNAAWLCRLAHPDETDTIAAAADLLWRKMLSRPTARMDKTPAQQSALERQAAAGKQS